MKKKNGGSFFSGLIYLGILYTIGGTIVNTCNQTISKDRTYSYSAMIKEEDISDDIIKNLENELSIQVEDDEKDELLLLNAVYENDKLSSNEKNLFYGFYSVINDIQCIDRERAYKSLSRVSINYNNLDDESNSVKGDYNHNTGKINIYIDPQNDKDNCVLLHEGLHCLFNNDKTCNLPRAFSEGMTELINNEYFAEDPYYITTYYPYEISYVKMLCELVGKDLVLDVYSNGNFNKIYEEIDANNDSSYSAFKILSIYEDSYNYTYGDYSSKYNTEEKWNAYKYLRDIYRKMHPEAENYKEFSYLYDLSACCFEEDPADYYIKYINYYGVLEKAYFNNSLNSTNFELTNLEEYRNKQKVKNR